MSSSLGPTGSKAPRLYKQGGRVYVYGDLNSGDEPDFTTPVFVVPEAYKPPANFDANDFVVGFGNGGGLGVAQFYDDTPGWGLYYVYSSSSSAYVGSAHDLRFTQVSWPAAS